MIPTKEEIEQCRHFALGGMGQAAGEFCIGAAEYAEADAEEDRVAAVFDFAAKALDVIEAAQRVSRFLVESSYYQGEKIDGAFDLERAVAAFETPLVQALAHDNERNHDD